MVDGEIKPFIANHTHYARQNAAEASLALASGGVRLNSFTNH
jgi:hypothetical protein